jgi:hypothetical protein
MTRDDGFRDGLKDLLPWTPTIAGVTALLCMLVLTAQRLSPAERTDAVAPPVPDLYLPPPEPAGPSPEDSPAPAVTPTEKAVPSRVAFSPSSKPAEIPATVPTVPAAPTAVPAVPATNPTETSTKTPEPATPPSAVGRYGVVGSYDAEFIGEVVISNPTAQATGWTVTLRFPEHVGDLRTSWVESAPQATLSRSGRTFVWRSGVPVDSGASVTLRFQFARTGDGDEPSSCTVNGTTCA